MLVHYSYSTQCLLCTCIQNRNPIKLRIPYTGHFPVYETLYVYNAILYNTLCLHCFSHFQKACDISASYIVAFLAIFLGSLIQAVENVDHDTL